VGVASNRKRVALLAMGILAALLAIVGYRVLNDGAPADVSTATVGETGRRATEHGSLRGLAGVRSVSAGARRAPPGP
jgi:hypothetical protein